MINAVATHLRFAAPWLAASAALLASACGGEPATQVRPLDTPAATTTERVTVLPPTLATSQDTTPDSAPPTAQATEAPPLRPVRLEMVFGGRDFTELTNLAQPDDGTGRFFLTEQPGRVLAMAGAEDAEPEVMLDIRDRVSDSSREEGLLGLALDPGFAENGHLWLYYSAAAPRRSVVSRFTVGSSSDAANPESELVVLEVPQPFANHNGGQLAFGPDGYLYLGLGDGGAGGDPQGNGQNVSTLLGSILRIDVSQASPTQPYRIPSDNPFAADPQARAETWAYGLRNPWRFSFDSQTGQLWVGDVGQNRFEEVDLVERGGNYGWNVLEGAHCFSPPSGCDSGGKAPPVLEYGSDRGCSVIGGFVYRAQDLPFLQGAYVYADFCSGEVFGIRYDGREITETLRLADTGLNVTSFGQDSRGELYLLSRNSGVYRLAP